MTTIISTRENPLLFLHFFIAQQVESGMASCIFLINISFSEFMKSIASAGGKRVDEWHAACFFPPAK
jgi:hypothetical protein